MARFKNKFVAGLIIGTMILGNLVGISSTGDQNTKIVYAKSKELTSATIKVNNLIKSLKSNYLGVRNIPTWQKYLDEIMGIVNKLASTKENQEANDLYFGKILQCENLIKAIASINQVEKSMTPIEQGGYGNYIGMKNVDTWNGYLKEAENALWVIENKSKEENLFEKQYNELVNRKIDAVNIIKGIEEKFNKEYEPLLELFEEAKKNNDIEGAKDILIEAEKLETCDKSNKLEMDLKMFIEGNDSADWRTMEGANFKYTMFIPKGFSKADLKSTPESESLIIKSTDENIKLGIEVSVEKNSVNTGKDYYEKYFKNSNVTLISLSDEGYEVEHINNGQVYNEKGILKNGYSYILKVNYPQANISEYKSMSEYIVKTFSIK